MSTVENLPKKKLTTSAMIASIANEGQPTKSAPFGHALNALAKENSSVVGLSADLSKYTDLHIFAKENPNKFFQMGMAEQLLMSAAAGLAREGFIPFATTYAVFASRRAYDFICMAIAEDNLNVKIVAALPGLTTGYGPSHQATDDIAIFRAMPNLMIEQVIPQIAAHQGPVYMRLLRGQVPLVLDKYNYQFKLGKAQVIKPGKDILIISTGLLTMRALEAAEELEKEGIEVSVLHVPTIKPLDEKTILNEVSKGGRPVLSAENHSVIGGLGEAVGTLLLRNGLHPQFDMIGLPDAFLDAGALPTLHDRYGISTEAVKDKIKKHLKS